MSKRYSLDEIFTELRAAGAGIYGEVPETERHKALGMIYRRALMAQRTLPKLSESEWDQAPREVLLIAASTLPNVIEGLLTDQAVLMAMLVHASPDDVRGGLATAIDGSCEANETHRHAFNAVMQQDQARLRMLARASTVGRILGRVVPLFAMFCAGFLVGHDGARELGYLALLVLLSYAAHRATDRTFPALPRRTRRLLSLAIYIGAYAVYAWRR